MLSIDWSTVGIILTIVSTVSGLTWWLSGQFSAIRNLVFERVSSVAKEILDKIEYHERHDDDRFSQIRSDLGDIRVRNASKDAMMVSLLSRLDKMNDK